MPRSVFRRRVPDSVQRKCLILATDSEVILNWPSQGIMGIVRSGLWVKCLSELRQTHAHWEPRAQLSAGMSATFEMYAQDIGVDVIPNDYFFSEVSSLGPLGPYTNTFPPSLKCQSSPLPPTPNHHHPPPPGLRGREGVEDGWHLRLVSSIIVKNLDTIGFTACGKDL